LPPESRIPYPEPCVPKRRYSFADSGVDLVDSEPASPDFFRRRKHQAGGHSRDESEFHAVHGHWRISANCVPRSASQHARELGSKYDASECIVNAAASTDFNICSVLVDEGDEVISRRHTGYRLRYSRISPAQTTLACPIAGRRWIFA